MTSSKALAKSLFLILITLIFIFTTSCAQSPQPTTEPTEPPAPVQQPTQGVSGEPVTIAFGGPITGPDAAYGKYLTDAAKLAVKHINDSGGINGHPLELLLGDTQDDPAQTALVAQKFVDNSKVMAVIGYFGSTTTLAALPIMDRGLVVDMACCATSQQLAGKSKWLFRVATPNDVQGMLLGKFVVSQLGAKKVAVMYGEDEGTLSILNPFKDAVTKAGAEIVGVETHQLGDQDYTSQITKLKPLGADTVFLDTNSNEAALIVKQSADAGWKVRFIGPDGIAGPDFIELAGKAAEGVYASAFWDPEREDAASKQFVTDYKTAYSLEPEQYGAHEYAAIQILAAALRSGAKTRDDVRAYLEKVGTTDGFDTVVGHVKWDEAHSAINPISILVVKDGKWVTEARQQ